VLPIAIDVMSGDHEPREYLAGALRALTDDPQLCVQLVGEPQLITAALAPLPASVRARATVVAASQVVAMEDKPREAIRRKKDSSMRLAIDLVQQGRACACVSAGNTGALTAIAHFVLGTLPGVERAAIISAIPAAHGHTHMLDLGANTKATPEQLRQFAAMGAIIARDVYGLAAPRIGLLNIGEEDMKGHEVVQAAHALLTRSGLNYVGFVEGDDIFSGAVDVVVTDGFTGNVALKTVEGAIRGTAKLVFDTLSSPEVSQAAEGVMPALLAAAQELDPDYIGGCTLLGVDGICVISHGSSNALAMRSSVHRAVECVEAHVVDRMKEAVADAG